MTRIITICTAFFILVACTQLPNQKELSITTEVTSQDRIRFQGKGAGAGMMLSGSMGPMGIAIGVAIDEGIGKTIDETAKQNHFNFSSLFEEKLRDFLKQQNIYTPENNIKLSIERYGFVTQSGDDDPVSAEIKAKVTIDEVIYVIDFPNTVNKKGDIPLKPLEQIKQDAEAITLLFEKSIELALVKTLSKSEK